MTTESKDEGYSRFIGWMNEFRLGDNDELMKRRWNAVKSLAADIDTEDLETLVRLALKTRQNPQPAALTKILAYFQKEDPQFNATHNARELEILSAASLLHVALSRVDELAAQSALCAATSLVAGARKPNLPFDLLSLSGAAISKLSRGAGRRPAPPTFKAIPRISFEAGAKQLAANDWANASQSQTASGAAVDAALQQLASQLSKVNQTMAQVLRQQDEELQVLWWLFGGHSEDLNATFDSLSGANKALVLAKELATHTRILPGPSSVAGLLAKAGLKSKGKVEVSAAINACKPEWLTPLVEGHSISPVIHPIHFGIQRQLEVGQGISWVENWAGVTELQPDLAFAPLTLGELFYRERLLVQAE